MPAALLGNLVYAGLATLLSTQSGLNALNASISLYCINSGQASAAAPDVALFQPGGWGQGTAALGAGIGFGSMTGPVLLYTRTGSTTVWYQGNTTAVPGDMMVAYFHSAIR